MLDPPADVVEFYWEGHYTLEAYEGWYPEPELPREFCLKIFAFFYSLAT